MPLTSNPYLEDPARMIAEVRAASRGGDNISTDCARAIASEWHRGQGTALFGFFSTGHFDGEGLLREIETDLACPELAATHGHEARYATLAARALSALHRYVRDRAIAD